MGPTERHQSVPAEILASLSDDRLILRETRRAVTPFGGLPVFAAFLRKIDSAGKVRQHTPVRWRPPSPIGLPCIAVTHGNRRVKREDGVSFVVES
jgi:hypothetical protein